MEMLRMMGWDPVLDMVAFCLCGITLLFLVRSKRRTKASARSSRTEMEMPDASASEPLPATGAKRYEIARRLAADGMAPLDIARQVDLPLKEITLMVKLWRKQGGEYMRIKGKMNALSGGNA